MNNLTRHIGLASQSSKVQTGDLMIVAAALQKQITRDLAPAWEISATVDAFKRPQDIPSDYWPILIRDDIGVAGLQGIHEDKNGQPFALVSASEDIDDWSLTASHEALEMLVDPMGRRLVAGPSVHPDQGRVNYKVEVADPCESLQFAYRVNDVRVSDFYLPCYFDPMPIAGKSYSYTGALTRPRQVLEGGYLSWQDIETGDWWQQVWFNDEPEFRRLGKLDAGSNLRAAIDSATPERVTTGRGGETWAKRSAGKAANKRAEQLLKEVRALERRVEKLSA